MKSFYLALDICWEWLEKHKRASGMSEYYAYLNLKHSKYGQKQEQIRNKNR